MKGPRGSASLLLAMLLGNKWLTSNCSIYTVEPPNKGHIGTRSFVLYREVSVIRRLKCTSIIGIGTNRFVLYREVFFIRSVLYQRFHCRLVNYLQVIYL